MTDEPFDRDETREANRLAEVLDAVEEGAPAPISAIEDPELASLVATASQLRDALGAATDTASFQSYRARSRAYILHSLEQRAAPPAPARGVVPFVRRRRWGILGSAAAAAAVATFALFNTTPAGAPTGSPAAGGEAGPAAASNLTAATAGDELDRIQQAIALLSERAQRGEPVDAPLLRTITENTAAVANQIDTAPQLVSRERVASYQKALTTGNAVLTAVQPSAGSEDALAAAQRATQDGVVAAARYLADDPTATATATKTATATATPAATSTPGGTATAKPTATAEPTATSTPATATPEPTHTATPEPTTEPAPEPTATAQPSATPAATAAPTATAEGRVSP